MNHRSDQVDAYLRDLEPGRRAALEALRDLVFQAVPDAAETMRYGMPAYERDDDLLCAFASQKRYVSLYVFDTDIVERHRAALGDLSVGKSCIRFTRLEQLPRDTIVDMLREAAQGG
jgi:uncharacterized protein YdhG (YjbR/CyaY superfamily)